MLQIIKQDCFMPTPDFYMIFFAFLSIYIIKYIKGNRLYPNNNTDSMMQTTPQFSQTYLEEEKQEQ